MDRGGWGAARGDLQRLGSRGGAESAESRQPPARPCPLEVESADAAVDVEDLAAEIEVGDDARFHRAHVHLIQRHTSRRDLGVLESAVAHDWQCEVDEIANDAATFII